MEEKQEKDHWLNSEKVQANFKSMAAARIECRVSDGKRVLHEYKSMDSPWTHEDCLEELLTSVLFFCEVHKVDFHAIYGKVSEEVKERMEYVGEQLQPPQEVEGVEAKTATYRVKVHQHMVGRKEMMVEARSEGEAEDKAEEEYWRFCRWEGMDFRMGYIFCDAIPYQPPNRTTEPFDPAEEWGGGESLEK